MTKRHYMYFSMYENKVNGTIWLNKKRSTSNNVIYYLYKLIEELNMVYSRKMTRLRYFMKRENLCKCFGRLQELFLDDALEQGLVTCRPQATSGPPN